MEKAKLKNFNASDVAYLCEIAKEIGNSSLLFEETYDDIFPFYLTILAEANKNTRQSLLQSIYDIINDSNLLRKLFQEFDLRK